MYKLFLENLLFRGSPIEIDSGQYHEIIAKLKFLGKVQKRDKIDTRRLTVLPDGIVTKITRTFFSVDNRHNTLNFVEGIVKRSFEIIKLHENSVDLYDRQLIVGIMADLRSSVNGISNLKNTYEDDVGFCCKIDVLIEFTNAKLKALEQKFADDLQSNSSSKDGNNGSTTSSPMIFPASPPVDHFMSSSPEKILT